jgi:hypothetical protein
MTLRRLGLCALTVLLGTTMAVASGGIASAGTVGSPGSSAITPISGGDIARLRLSGSCGDQLDMRLRVAGGPLKVAITIPSADPTEVWNISVTEQNFGAVTGGRIGDPVDLIASGALPPPTFSTTEGGFSTEGDVANTSGFTHGFSYVATRTSPTPLTCTNTGFWTAPAGSDGPTAENPSGKPDTAPALTGNTEADAGANDVRLQFDQEMLTTAQGTPDTGQFSVTVDGVARTVTGVAIIDDSPPLDATLDLTFDGTPLTSGQTVSVLYRQSLTGGAPALQDLDGLLTANFGPVSVPVF